MHLCDGCAQGHADCIARGPGWALTQRHGTASRWAPQAIRLEPAPRILFRQYGPCDQGVADWSPIGLMSVECRSAGRIARAHSRDHASSPNTGVIATASTRSAVFSWRTPGAINQERPKGRSPSAALPRSSAAQSPGRARKVAARAVASRAEASVAGKFANSGNSSRVREFMRCSVRLRRSPTRRDIDAAPGSEFPATISPLTRGATSD